MSSVDTLILEAKQAILDEQHRRWRTLHEAGQRDEAARQCQSTLACAADLLNESLRILDSMLSEKKHPDNQTPPASEPPSAL